MDELQNYRARIGQFTQRSCHQPPRKKYAKQPADRASKDSGGLIEGTSDNQPRRTRSSSTHRLTSCSVSGPTLTLLILMGLASWTLANDPGIETNPGPERLTGSGRLPWMSESELPIFQHLRKINNNIAQSASHRFFLFLCRDKGIIPRGYIPKDRHCTPNPTPKLRQHHSDNKGQYLLRSIDIDIEHASTQLKSLQNTKMKKLQELKISLHLSVTQS